MLLSYNVKHKNILFSETMMVHWHKFWMLSKVFLLRFFFYNIKHRVFYLCTLKVS